MTITSEMVKELRESTGAGVLDCKKALVSAAGDMDRACTILREKGLAGAVKKASRTANQGLIEAYVHMGKAAALVELNCETDFVARTPDFKALAHDLAMQVVASRPQYVRPEDVPAEVVEKEKAIYRAQIADQNKPEAVVEKIAEGKLAKFFEEVCILKQPTIRDPNVSVEDSIKAQIAKTGENIVLRRFVRFEIGQS